MKLFGKKTKIIPLSIKYLDSFRRYILDGWQAKSGKKYFGIIRALEQINSGTYSPEDIFYFQDLESKGTKFSYNPGRNGIMHINFSLKKSKLNLNLNYRNAKGYYKIEGIEDGEISDDNESLIFINTILHKLKTKAVKKTEIIDFYTDQERLKHQRI